MPPNPFDPSRGTANPFEPPQAIEPPRSFTPGVLDLGKAISDGWESTWRNFGSWLAVMFVGGALAVVVSITVIGIFVVLPVIGWGAIRFTLNAVDGEAKLGDLFDGFNRYGLALGTMLGVGFLIVLISIPGQALVQAAPIIGGDSMFAMIGVGYIISFAWTLAVVMRFYFAPFLVVDQGLGAIEALKQSWAMTSTQKLNVALLGFVGFLIVIAGMMALLVGVIPATAIFYGSWASAYRQLSGTTPRTRSSFG